MVNPIRSLRLASKRELSPENFELCKQGAQDRRLFPISILTSIPVIQKFTGQPEGDGAKLTEEYGCIHGFYGFVPTGATTTRFYNAEGLLERKEVRHHGAHGFPSDNEVIVYNPPGRFFGRRLPSKQLEHA